MSPCAAAAYRGVRERVSGIVAGLDEAACAAVVPATPAWSVHDVLAHLVGVTRDAVEGRLDGVSTPAWTAAQVDARRALTTGALLAEWNEYGARFERRLARLPEEVGGQAVLDAVSHEHDLRHATGRPGEQASDAVAVAFTWACGVRGAPALRFVTEAGERVAGVGDPVATVTASRFEVLRASTGRRSGAEVRALGVPDPAVVLLAPIFTLRRDPLREG